MNRFFANRQTPSTRKATFRPRIEELESRTLLSDTNLGSLTGFDTFSDNVTGSKRDIYTFTVPVSGDFSAFLVLLSRDCDLHLAQINDDGIPDIAVSNNPGNSDESISMSLSPGTYRLFVNLLNPVTIFDPGTSYFLVISADYAGGTRAAARDLGPLAGTQTLFDAVTNVALGPVDHDDFYRFSTFTPGTMSVSLTGLNNNADLRLLDASGQPLISSTNGGTASESITTVLNAAATFFIHVDNAADGTQGTNYQLLLTVTPADGAGNTLTNAKVVPASGQTAQQFNDFVGNIDHDDFYKVFLAGPGPFNFNATLNGLSADANLELIRDDNPNNGAVETVEKLAISSNTGTTAETISKTLDKAGDYFVRVRRGSGNTAYALTLSAVSTDTAGNTLASARNLGTLKGRQSFTDFVGNVDTDDFYKFVLAAGSRPLTAVLSGLSANVDLELIEQSTGNSLVITPAGSISRFLIAGTYFVHVKGVNDTSYTLTLTPDYGGNSLAAARVVSAGIFNDFVADSDTDDFYRITLANDSTLTGTLSGLGADANLELIFNANQNNTVDAGETLASSFIAGTGIDSFTRALAKGTYFVRVVPGAVNRITQSTNYKLILSVTPGSASIAGTTFEDIDRNGANGAGDLPLASAVVFLDANNNGIREDTERFALTSTSGSYPFTGLNAGTYQVRQIVQAGFLAVPTVPATGFYTVTLGAGQAVIGKDFGNVRPPASISGLVFNDVDGNGANGAGDLPQEGVILFLDANNNGVREAAEKFAQTNASGNYSFTGLNAGTYQVRQQPLAGFLAAPTAPAAGFYTVTLSPGQDVTGKDFGIAKSASISGLVFDDVNGNGANGAGDLPLASAVVFLDANNNGTREAGERFALTDTSGFYPFSDLSAGTYQVRQELPAGFLAAPTVPGSGFYTVTVRPGLNVLSVDFGNVRPASITGQVFEDLNGNSVRDAGDTPLANWIMFLDTNNNLTRDALEPEALSDGLGNYAFTNLRPGSYSVFQELQPGFTQTLPLPAGSHSVALTSGQNVIGRDFAFSKLIVDNVDAILTGAWIVNTTSAARFGVDFLRDGNADKGNKSARFVANIPVTGSYQVFARWPANANRASNTPIDVVHRDGTTTVLVDQRVNGGVFVPLGTFFFSVGLNGIVVIRNGGTMGQVIADAIQFVRQPPVAPSNLVATVLPGSQVLLGWKDNSLSEAGFKIQRSTSRHFKRVEEITVSTVNANSYADALTRPGKYYYRVLAYGVSGHSSFSSAIKVRMPAGHGSTGGVLAGTPFDEERNEADVIKGDGKKEADAAFSLD